MQGNYSNLLDEDGQIRIKTKLKYSVAMIHCSVACMHIFCSNASIFVDFGCDLWALLSLLKFLRN